MKGIKIVFYESEIKRSNNKTLHSTPSIFYFDSKLFMHRLRCCETEPSKYGGRLPA